MTRRLYLDQDELASGFVDGVELRLEGAPAHRLRDVLRLEAGATLAVFDGRGCERDATLTAVARGGVTLRLGAARAAAAEPPVAVTLACAFPRGRRGDWLVEKATELGVAAFAPLVAERSVLRPGDGRLDRWRRIAIEAAEQSGRAVLPRLRARSPAGRRAADRRPRGDRDHPRGARGSGAAAGHGIALYVGPEGGWSPAEREALLAGTCARPITLGPRRLRVETAAIVGLAQVLAATGGL